ncbi:hypothetical protein SLEP1_g54783 [Rubroshorea leprosula]|uniref:Uncharacterized protein n=1 Tax=Rubroshorea leprosula TaxID=152421 RepID=A0AAV5MH76_9ROSI|nr:hypothetical protein SLEP1_g54783 [Rubroshorea leprosula]
MDEHSGGGDEMVVTNLIVWLCRKQSREVGFLFFTIVSSDSRTTTMNNE